jgi:hypothetical protein
MKLLPRILIMLAAPAGVLYGLNQIGGTSISKGYDMGFHWQAQGAGARTGVELSKDAATVNCWIKLKVPVNSLGFEARLTTSVPLKVNREGLEGSDEWIVISGAGQNPQEMFAWAAGAAITLTPKGNLLPVLAVSDWRVNLSDKDYDSASRAWWRKILLRIAVVCFFLSLIGLALSAWMKEPEKKLVLTAQSCIEALIDRTSGNSDKESEWMRIILRGVLLEQKSADDAMKPVPLGYPKNKQLWFAARNQFKSMLTGLINELASIRARHRLDR